MLNVKNLLLVISILFNTSNLAQNFIPNIALENLENNIVYTDVIFSEDKFYIVSFWATWCIPCINELDAIVETYPDRDNNNSEVIAISIDDSRTRKRVRPMINGKDWEFKILIDENHDLKRSLNIVGIPHTIITKGKEIIYRRIGYSPGEEIELFEFIENFNRK
jgi:peroxiredoxin